MNETKRMNIEEFKEGFLTSQFKLESVITKKYIPVMDKNTIMENIISILTAVYDENDEPIFGELDLDVNSVISDVFIKVAIINEYTNIDTSDRQLVYDTLMQADNLFNYIFESIGQDAIDFENMFKARLNEKVAYLKEQQLLNKQSPMDEFFMSLTGLVAKLDSIDLQSLQTVLPQLAKLGETGLDQNKLVDLILKNRPKDHKKPAKAVAEKKPKAKKTTTKLEVVADKVEE